MWIVAPEGYEHRGVWLEGGPLMTGPFLRQDHAEAALSVMRAKYPARKYKIYKIEDVDWTT